MIDEGPYKEALRQRVAGLPPLQKAMLALDVALTGHEPEDVVRQYHHYPVSLEHWIKRDGWQFVWYLSDGGYSRVVWNEETGNLFLTDNSRREVKERWEAAAPQRQAVAAELRKQWDEMAGPRQEAEDPKFVLEAYEPTPDHVAWAQEFIKTVNHGTTWHVPYTGQVYRVDKENRTLTLIAGNPKDEDGWHSMNAILFAQVGYRVLPEIGSEEQSFAEALSLSYDGPLGNADDVQAEALCLAENILNESPRLPTLKARRRALSPAERADAGGAPVWKATVNGKTYYVVNTHRCYQTSPTVKGAARAWRDTVEQTG